MLIPNLISILVFTMVFLTENCVLCSKNGIFHGFLSRILLDKKRESSDVVHLVEQVILYKTLYMAMLCNSIFPNIFLAQEYILWYRQCVAYMKGQYCQNIDKTTIFYSQNVAQIRSNQNMYNTYIL
jgi:hypothetical protein